MGHAIECCTANQGFRPLCCQQTRRQAATEDGFETEHRVFYRRAHMVARPFFPGLAAYLTNGAQVLVPFQGFGFAIAMLPDARIFARRDQHCGLRRIAVRRAKGARLSGTPKVHRTGGANAPQWG